MMTAIRFAVSWCYREGDKSIRRTLYHHTMESCVEAARLIAGNPYSFDIEVTEIDTGKSMAWEATAIGCVLCQ